MQFTERSCNPPLVVLAVAAATLASIKITDWLIDWSIDWSIDRLIDWLSSSMGLLMLATCLTIWCHSVLSVAIVLRACRSLLHHSSLSPQSVSKWAEFNIPLDILETSLYTYTHCVVFWQPNLPNKQEKIRQN